MLQTRYNIDIVLIHCEDALFVENASVDMSLRFRFRKSYALKGERLGKTAKVPAFCNAFFVAPE